MIALLLLAAVPVVMWAVQTAQFRRAGFPIRWRIDADGAPKSVRAGGRIATQISLFAVIVAYPLICGQGVLAYYQSLLPPGPLMLQFIHGAAVSVLFLCFLFGVWLATGRLEIDIHHSRKKWIRRLVLLIPTALFGAFVEELLFRGVLLNDLLLTSWIPRPIAIAAGAVIFAAAHYVRAVKRRWTFPGHVMLGLLLCVAFVQTRTLWLPAGLHAGGILAIMGLRPFVRYRGPAWITGASIFPFAGVVGIAGLALLTGFVHRYYGPP
ncbi:MAG TPA: CPBP family intramembrane glutamic endopeptidase [Phycisphaerae bacterium]|nr:CPBP family intramembrane glutamic endopeptidase [Phycisphaerae bacterium]